MEHVGQVRDRSPTEAFGLVHAGTAEAPGSVRPGFGEAQGFDLALLEAIAGDDGVLVLTPSRGAGTVVWVNARFLELTGYQASEVLGREGLFLAGPETDPQELAMCRAAILGGTQFERVLLHTTKDGRLYWDRVQIAPVFDAAGGLTHLVSRHRNVGRELELQRTVDEQQRLLSFIEDSGAIGVLQLDRATNILRINAAFSRRFGYEPGELAGQPVTVLLPEIDHAKARRRMADALSARAGSDVREWRILTRDGELRTVVVNAITPDRAGHRDREPVAGPLPSMVMIVTDVTEHKQSQQALLDARDAAEVASRAKSTFLANVSHELRTPLNAILGFSEIMAYGLLGPIGVPRYAEYVTDIHRSARHLLDIINNLLDISKIEAGRMELRETVVDLEESARDSLAIIQPRLEGHALELAFEVAEDLPLVRADQTKLRQILVNLLSNAIKFTPAEGRVTLSLFRTEDGKAGFTVTDTGVGMTEAEIRTALEPFMQVDNALSRRVQGTGLGLPLTQALVAQHGGELQIASSRGEGTRVTVLLPVDRTLA